MISTVDIPKFQKEKCRIGMVLDQPFPPDARVEREAVALSRAGYEVHLLCVFGDEERRQQYAQREEVYRGIFIHRVLPEEVSILIPGMNLPTRFPYHGAFKNFTRMVWNLDNTWYSLISRFVKRYRIDVLHIHDLRLVSTGLWVARQNHIPLVADLHENYPALMKMLKGKKNARRGQRELLKWQRIESACMTAADRVITVIEEAQERLIDAGVSAQKIVVLPNTVDIPKFEAAKVDPAIIRRFKSSFLLTYVGHINSDHRGIHTVLEAMALLKNDIPEIFFMGAGAVREQYFTELQAIVKRHGLESHVDFTGWLDESDFVSYIQAADICLCPHLATEHTNTTFPNKVYLYNLFAKPVLVSSCTPLKRYIAESHGGRSFEAGHVESLALQIRDLYEDADLRRKLGEQGRKAVLQRFNWDKTSTQLIQMYDRLMGVRRLETTARLEVSHIQ